MSYLNTLANAIGTAASVGSTAAAAYSAVEGRKEYKRSRQDQELAQAEARGQATRTERRNQADYQRVNRRKPDLAAILLRSMRGGRGVGGTMLTGPGGVDGLGGDR